MQVYNGDLAAPGPECVLGQSIKSERALDFLSPDNQEAAVSCMWMSIFTTMYGCYCLWIAFLIWTTTQLSLIASIASEKIRSLCYLQFVL